MAKFFRPFGFGARRSLCDECAVTWGHKIPLHPHR